MIILEVFYVALATLAIMALLQLLTFAFVRIMYPPQPKVIYRDVPVQVSGVVPVAAVPQVASPVVDKPVFTQQTQEVQLPEYEPRVTPTTTSLRLDTGLPDSLQETRPPGT